MTHRIGVDFGGTKIEAIALSPEGEISARLRVVAPQGDYQTSIDAVVSLVRDIEAEIGESGCPIGLGLPGSPSPFTGLMRNGNATWLNGRPFTRDLGAALGQPLRAANDANCFAVSEAADGAGAGARSVFGVILGTGVGGGLVIDGQPVDGANGVAGEWGHMPLPRPSAEELLRPPCWCGRQGCLETWLSGGGLCDDYDGAAAAPDGRALAELAAQGDAAAEAALSRYIDRLGRALSVVVNIVDPEVVILGGGLSNIEALTDRAFDAMRPHVFSDECRTRIVRNAHGDSSGVRGAAWLWRKGETA
ncbi:MAG: ROK family protein [Pseudomonadota bacterium]